MTLSSEPRWYVAATQPHREAGAAVQLARQGFDVFWPQIDRTVKHARQLRTRRVSLFPGYLFVSLDLDRDRWRSVNGTFGVRALVMAGDRPVPVPSGLVEDLRGLAAAGGLIQFDTQLAVGQDVRVLTGPFADLIGQLDRLDDQERVRLLLHIMGTTIPVTLQRSALIPAA
jgi:transcription elongation factor/antiterminator RfaH